MMLLPVILSWLGPMPKAHGTAVHDGGGSQLEGDGGRSPHHDPGTAAGTDPTDERSLFDSAKVSIPPPSLSLKPTTSKLGGRGPPSSINGGRENPSPPLNSFLTVSSHQLAYNSISSGRDRDGTSTSSSPMRRSKSAAGISRCTAGDSQQPQQQLLRHSSLHSRAEQHAGTRISDVKRRVHTTNVMSACSFLPQHRYPPEEHRRSRRWSCGSRLGESVLQDSAGCRQQPQQIPSTASQGHCLQQKHRSIQSKQLIPHHNLKNTTSSSGRRPSQHRSGVTAASPQLGEATRISSNSQRRCSK